MLVCETRNDFNIIRVFNIPLNEKLDCFNKGYQLLKVSLSPLSKAFLQNTYQLLLKRLRVRICKKRLFLGKSIII